MGPQSESDQVPAKGYARQQEYCPTNHYDSGRRDVVGELGHVSECLSNDAQRTPGGMVCAGQLFELIVEMSIANKDIRKKGVVRTPRPYGMRQV